VGINLTKEVEDLYNENNKTLKKETQDDGMSSPLHEFTE
jgi:hypothetical protein